MPSFTLFGSVWCFTYLLMCFSKSDIGFKNKFLKTPVETFSPPKFSMLFGRELSNSARE